MALYPGFSYFGGWGDFCLQDPSRYNEIIYWNFHLWIENSSFPNGKWNFYSLISIIDLWVCNAQIFHKCLPALVAGDPAHPQTPIPPQPPPAPLPSFLWETGCFGLSQPNHANRNPLPSGVSNHQSHLGWAEIWFSASSAYYKGIGAVSERTLEVCKTH